MSSPELTYYDMGTDVLAFSTTRHGGCSTGNYAAFNINMFCGDDPVHIAANRQALCRLLDIPIQQLVIPHQVHGTTIRRIDTPPTETIEGVDAVMTNRPQICVGVSTADCIPILLYDTRQKAVCAVHAGWRGTVNRIAEKAVSAMHDAYGTEPTDIHAVIGPGISLDSFEVGDEVYEQFAQAGFNMLHIARHDAKWHIDLPLCNQLQLEAMGVTDIHQSDVCTYQQYDQYFSARRLGIDSGRIYTAIMLK